MRTLHRCFFFLVPFLLGSCLTVKKLNTSLEQPMINISELSLAQKPFASVTIPKGILLDSVFYPSGFVPTSFSTRTGIMIIPLLIYNRFQSNYLITLGAAQFDPAVNEAFKERFQSLLAASEDSTKELNHQYRLTMDLQSCQVQGVYVHGSWGAFYLYGTMSGIIDHGRNASSFVRIRWELSEDGEPITGGNVMVTLKDSYLSPISGFLTANGHREELTKEDLTFGIPFDVRFGRDPYLNYHHINQMVQVLCLSLDKASETILGDLQKFFRDHPEN